MNLCPECLTSASADQRRAAQNGRCLGCIASLARRYARRKAAKVEAVVLASNPRGATD